MKRALAAVAAAVLLAAVAPGAASAQEPPCLSADPPEASAPPQPLRFGITPQLAGSAGGEQGAVAPEDPALAGAALGRLQPPGRRLVMRLNRLFMADGQAGIDRFTALAREYARAGFDVESQIRYHPAPQDEGDMAKWERFLRDATRALAANPALVALSITNEVNLPLSSNTSDGAYERAVDALVLGVPAAREELEALGRRDVSLGFTYAWRYLPDSDVEFWREIGAKATPAFRAALGHVGVQLYPGLFWPPVLLPGQTAGDETLEALTIVRRCYMPLAGLGDEVGLWITENGYPTNFGRTPERQVNDLRSTVEDVHRLSGTLGVADYRYFNLRDNRSAGTDLFDAVGLLREDYAEKPAFGAYRELIATLGAQPPARRCERSVRLPRLRGGERYRRVSASVAGRRVPARLLRAAGRRPAAAVSVPAGTHRLRLTLRTNRGRVLRQAVTVRGCG